EELGVVADRVRVEEFVPLSALAPTCDVMVHHGGFGTIGTTSLHAVPQLAVAEEIDAPILARGLAVAHEVERMLTDSSFTEGARRLRADMLAMPSPADVVPTLVRLAERHRRGPAGAGDDVVGPGA
ncbi:nucleotide disphospho-sugar-binding domain-containing protein, partial [Streptomyces aureocirculatus]|uniref:nucleotide disphospho-sugar-binding domain-containing protein n=1 Tax=Streptomyces aureocirculatus TaxID=67275 RepID=UPI003242D596